MVLDLFGTLKNVSEEQWSTKFRILRMINMVREISYYSGQRGWLIEIII